MAEPTDWALVVARALAKRNLLTGNSPEALGSVAHCVDDILPLEILREQALGQTGESLLVAVVQARARAAGVAYGALDDRVP